MSPDPTRRFQEQTAAQQRLHSPFLRIGRVIFRYGSALVSNVVDAEDIVQQTALAFLGKFGTCDSAFSFTPWVCRFALNKVNPKESHSSL